MKALHGFQKFATWVLAWLSLLPLMGCAVVVVHAPDKTVVTDWRFGVLSVDLKSGESSGVKVHSLGLSNSIFGFVAGFQSAQVIHFGQECRLILWDQTARQAANLRELLGDRKDICSVGEDFQ